MDDSSSTTTKQTIPRSIDLSVAILVSLLNIIEIIIICKLKRKKRNYEICLLSLCCSDLLFGVSNIVVSIMYLSNSRRFEDVYETTYSIYLLVVFSSMLHLSWIALERLWVVAKPFQHRIYVTRKNIYILLACTWISTVLVTASLYLTEELTEETNRNTVSPTKISSSVTGTRTTVSTSTTLSQGTQTTLPREGFKKKVQLTVAIIIIIADLLLLVCYGTMSYLLQVKTKVNKINAKKEDRMSVVCCFIAATFVVFTLPYAIAVFINGVAGFGPNLVLLMNSGMNCIVYFFSYKM